MLTRNARRILSVESSLKVNCECLHVWCRHNNLSDVSTYVPIKTRRYGRFSSNRNLNFVLDKQCLSVSRGCTAAYLDSLIWWLKSCLNWNICLFHNLTPLPQQLQTNYITVFQRFGNLTWWTRSGLWSLRSGGCRYGCSTGVAKLFGVKEKRNVMIISYESTYKKAIIKIFKLSTALHLVLSLQDILQIIFCHDLLIKVPNE
jgi:hypothetical protein